MSNDSNTRRRFLQVTGAAATLAIAGCTGGGGGGGGGEDTTEGDGGDSDTDTDTDSETTTSGEMTTTSGSMEVPSEVNDYLSDVSNFDGTVEDMTGQSTVTVEVGASGNNGNFAFAPAAIVVDSGTTVQFEWTGQGGVHNVVAESGAFDSGSSVEQSGVNFEHTFAGAGNFLYYCTPHKTLGMKGAVIVQ